MIARSYPIRFLLDRQCPTRAIILVRTLNHPIQLNFMEAREGFFLCPCRRTHDAYQRAAIMLCNWAIGIYSALGMKATAAKLAEIGGEPLTKCDMLALPLLNLPAVACRRGKYVFQAGKPLLRLLNKPFQSISLN